MAIYYGKFELYILTSFFYTVFFSKKCHFETSSILLFFETFFPDGHCAKLAIKYSFHGIEKWMTSYFKAHWLYFHMKKTKIRKKKKIIWLLKAILQWGKMRKLLKLDPECVKPVILFPFHSKTESCEISKVYVSEFSFK